MSKRAFDKVMAGLDSARAYLDGTADKRRYRVHVPEKVDAKKIRTRRGLSEDRARGSGQGAWPTKKRGA